MGERVERQFQFGVGLSSGVLQAVRCLCWLAVLHKSDKTGDGWVTFPACKNSFIRESVPKLGAGITGSPTRFAVSDNTASMLGSVKQRSTH